LGGSPLRIVIDARIQDGVAGGVQQWVIGLANALSQLDDGTEEYLFLVDDPAGHWLTPYMGGPCRLLPGTVRPAAGRTRAWVAKWTRRPRAWAFAMLPVLRSAWGRLLHWESSRSISSWDRAIEHVNADVVHFTMQSAFLTGTPNIYQPWDLQHLHLPEFFSAADRAAREMAYRAFCNQASLIVVASNWVKDDVVDQLAIHPDKIAVVNVPPVTVAYPEPDATEIAEIAERLKLPERFIYYPAQTWGHKNHLRLLEALGSLRAAGLTVPLVCSGHRTELYPELVAAASRLGIERDVRFLGFLKPTEVRVLYRTARALVFPSLYEGWGLPIVEAFASGLPVACSNVTSLPELVGDAALVFDPYDQEQIADVVRRIWLDDALAQTLVARGTARLDRFDWHRTALTMRAHYRSVAGWELDEEDSALLGALAAV
jgi:glycosyltransferase involved in cell wall biosynthesis